MPAIPRIAIACQGGGSHAAFVAGVLVRLLGPELRDRFRLVALSGTSGGAICAALAWAGLLSNGPDDAINRLAHFWRDLEVHDLPDAVTNFWGLWLSRLPFAAEISPYLYEPAAEPKLRALLSKHLQLENLTTDVARRRQLQLLVGATDVLSGDRIVFDGERLTYDHLIASAAVPPLYRAVPVDGRLYWDGLFATNPPVREFTDLSEPPDEIWVIQINPQMRSSEPRTLRDIVDRRNELSGNLSLGQELYFIDKMNRLLKQHETLCGNYKYIQIRVVELGVANLDYPSKLDRSEALIERLIQNGEERAEWFFDVRSTWPRKGTAPAKAVRPTRAGTSE
jgi:NTE family protein